MSAPPTVSVVLIFLDAEPFLDQAIRSVRAQSLGDWELLLVDDGSRDASGATARRHAAEEPGRIRYLEHEGRVNLGMSASRNLGIVHASGRYVTFLDADDVLLPDALRTLTTLLEREPRAAMAYGPVEYWYRWAGAASRRADFVQRLGVPTGVLLEPPHLLLAFLRRRAAAPSGMIVRAGVLRRVGGFVEAFRGMYEDQAFCAKLCLAHPVVTTGTCSYRYRQHPASSSAAADRSGEHDFGRRAFLEWLAGYLDGQGVQDGPVREALRRELWWCDHPVLSRLARRVRRTVRKLVPRASV
ncbi:MAG TPA: glycosyltransferase family 2 protein [Gemmatimonadales bacterium]|nr:glycosyltransferase family 2 protein [Gemmatimonadales bacterium]